MCVFLLRHFRIWTVVMRDAGTHSIGIKTSEIVCQNHSLITDTELIIGQDRLIRTADRQWIDIDTDRIR